jgi:hypothetical protein
MRNGVKVLFTAEENAIRDAEEAAWEAAANNRALERLRTKRNELLKESDWRASSDLSMSDEWKTYRQALRDLPATTSDPINPTWPDEPE